MEGGWRLHFEDIKESLLKVFGGSEQMTLVELEKQLLRI